MSGLKAKALDWRRNFIGGSDAPRIMSGDWYQLWLEKTGRAEIDPDDLLWELPVQMGIMSEPLNRRWYEHKSGNTLKRIGESVICEQKDRQYLACTLDGFVYPDIVFQAKHVNAFAKVEEVHDKYLPQVTHEMICTGATTAHLSIFIGTLKHEVIQIQYDPFYAEDYMKQAETFWHHVRTDTTPVTNANVVFTPKMAALRKVDMSTSNAWGEHAANWLASEKAAKTFKTATDEIKALVEEDVCEATGKGIIVKRAKNGALSIKREK